VFLVGVFACSSAQDRPPPVGDCVPPACGIAGDGAPRGSGGAGGRPTPDSGHGTGGTVLGTGGSGGRAGAGSGLSGSVKIYSNALFTTTSAFTAAGTISLTGSKSVSGAIAAGTWSVQGAENSATLWASLHATASPEAMDTLEMVDGTAATADVVFAPADAVRNVVESFSSLQSGTAQVVLAFVDATNKPLSGVKIAQAGANVAYDAGSTYTNQQGAPPLGATQQRGIAILFNYPAAAPPGAPFTIAYVKPGANTAISADVRLMNGAVTFRTVVVK